LYKPNIQCKDISNQKFGKLLAIEPVGSDGHGNVQWKCLCDCGKELIVRGNSLRNGTTRSCGCLQRETASRNLRKNNLYHLFEDYGVGYTTNTNQIFYFDIEDFEIIKNFCWVENDQGYIVANPRNGKSSYIRMHRLVTNNQYKIVDHIDCNKKNNRKNNLRPATRQTNNINRCNGNINNKIGVKGVGMLSNGRYIGRISKNKKEYLKCFDDIKEAIAWRKSMEEQLYGEYSYKGGA
jgi:hypothetical protein